MKLITEVVVTLIRQGKESVSLILFLVFIPLAILAAVYLISYGSGIPLSVFLKDASQTLDSPSYLGIISDAGIFLLFGISLNCFLTYAVIRKGEVKSFRPGFFLYFGCFILLLMVDDKFLLHEMVYAVWLPEKVIYLTYLSILGLGILIFQKELLESRFILLLLGAGFLGMSLAVDLFQERIEERIGSIRILIEDGFKFIGFVVWFGFFFITCRHSIRQVMRTSRN